MVSHPESVLRPELPHLRHLPAGVISGYPNRGPAGYEAAGTDPAAAVRCPPSGATVSGNDPKADGGDYGCFFGIH